MYSRTPFSFFISFVRMKSRYTIRPIASEMQAPLMLVSEK